MSKEHAATVDQGTILSPESHWHIRQSWLIVFDALRTCISLCFGKDMLALNLLAFLLGRVSMLGELIPFGLAYFIALTRTRPVSSVAVGIWALAGSVSVGYLVEAAWYAVFMTAYYVFIRRERRLQQRWKTIHFVIATSLALAGIGLLLWQYISLYQLLLIGFTIAACVSLTIIFSHVIPLLSIASLRQATEEQLACLVVILSAAIAGLGQVQFMGYSLFNTMSSCFIMLMALQGGVGLGVSVGAAVGIVAGLTGGSGALAVAYYVVASLLGGIFSGMGKFAVPLGYLIGCVIAVSYFNANDQLIPALIESVSGAILFLAVAGWRGTWQKCQAQAETVFPDHAVAVAGIKLCQLSALFSDLAGSFARTAAASSEGNEDVRQVVDRLGEQVCKTCGNKEYCWEKQFYTTYQSFLDVLSLPPQVKIDIHSLPQHLRQSCQRQQELLTAAAEIVGYKRAQFFLQKRTLECRLMLAEQMQSASSIVATLAAEIQAVPQSDKQREMQLTAASREGGCELEQITVTGQGGALFITGRKQPCSGDMECTNKLAPVIAAAVGKRVTVESECGSKALRRKCRVAMRIASRYAVTFGAASIAKGLQGISGDTCSVTEAGHGRVAAIISDGMGSGPAAADESQAAVRFLEKLLVAGFSVDAAAKSVNSMLLLRLPGECYTTIDVAIFDLYSGEVEFLKTGSAVSYIKRVREVSTVQSTSLPVGIIEHVEIEPEHRKLAVGDTVVMVSDGIAEADRQRPRRDWVANFLRLASDADPQKLANAVLEQAQKLAGTVIKDDMTVLVIKIHERLGTFN